MLKKTLLGVDKCNVKVNKQKWSLNGQTSFKSELKNKYFK